MRAPKSLRFVGLLVILGAAAFVIWTHSGRVRHVEHVSAVGGQPAAIDVASATGLAGATRAIIVPAHHRESYEWITRTQQMLSRGELRVRHIDYENAPAGRPVVSTSPYRWWLATVAWVDHAMSGRPLGLSVERAALYSDPVLHMVFLLITAGFVVWQFGWAAAACAAVGIAGLFPFAAGFLAGAPDDLSFATMASFASVLVLLPGIRTLFAGDTSPQETTQRIRFARRWFVAGGIFGGGALWISVQSQMPVLLGIALGALVSAFVARDRTRLLATDDANNHAAKLWRVWAVSGSVTVALAYLIEFFPSHLWNGELTTIHPLYALAWLGLGEGIARATSQWPSTGSVCNRRGGVVITLAILAIAALPAWMWFSQSSGFLPTGESAYQLTRLPDGITARNLWHWLTRLPLDGQFLATIAPSLLLLPASWWAFRRAVRVSDRALIAFALGPCVIALAFACAYLSRWHVVDALILILVVVGVALTSSPNVPRLARQAWFALVILVLLPGFFRLWPRPAAAEENAAPLLEVEGVIERDLARWLAKRIGNIGNAVVWAPPDTTNTLYFYGGLRGIGTFAPDNAEGLAASFQLARAGAHEEALALVRRREITHLVLPSWDPFFDQPTTSSDEGPPVGFLAGLQRWVLPSWLRPVPYQLPLTARVENYAVQVFEVVQEQEPALALSRLAEYFVETGDLNGAAWADQSLQRYPADIHALTARAHVLTAGNETDGYTRVMDTLKNRLRGRADRFLPWDRRVSLAIALARQQDIDRAREQTQTCLKEIDESKLRSLSSGMLLNFQLLVRALELEIADPKLRGLAQELLPEELKRLVEGR